MDSEVNLHIVYWWKWEDKIHTSNLTGRKPLPAHLTCSRVWKQTWHLLYILVLAVCADDASSLFTSKEWNQITHWFYTSSNATSRSLLIDWELSLSIPQVQSKGRICTIYVPAPYNNPRMHLMPAKREITSSTLDLAQLQHAGENFLQVSGRELSRSQGNLRPPGSTLDPKDKQMSRSMSRLPDAHTTRLTPPSVRVEFVENGPQSSLSDDSEEFSDNDSSFSGSDSLNRSDTEEQLRQSRTPTPDSSGSLSPKSAEGGKMIGSRSDPSLNKMPSTPKIPPRPQAQEILQRCTTVTRKNLQRTS